MTNEIVVTGVPGRLEVWLTAIRPRTLSIAVTPVIVGLALAAVEAGPLALATALATLLCAVLIQIGTNLHNDAADFACGNDGADRLGPLRVCAAGWATAGEVRRAAMMVFLAAFVIGIFLALRGGWPIVLIGLAALAAAGGYSGGFFDKTRPLSHTTLGKLCVWLFFGLAAVAGSYWLQAGRWSWTALVAGAGLGGPAAAVLLINNLRDLDADGRVGRRTLAAVLGSRRARQVATALMLLPFAAALALATRHPGALLTLLALPPVLKLSARLRGGESGRSLNALLAATALSELGVGLLLAIGVNF